MFGRAMADRHGVGIIVSIDYHGASYGIQTPRLLCKHLTAAEVHPVPAGLTLAHRLGPDATPARRFAATAVDDGAFQRLFEAYKPDSDAPDHLLHRQTLRQIVRRLLRTGGRVALRRLRELRLIRHHRQIAAIALAGEICLQQMAKPLYGEVQGLFAPRCIGGGGIAPVHIYLR